MGGAHLFQWLFDKINTTQEYIRHLFVSNPYRYKLEHYTVYGIRVSNMYK